MKKSQDQVSALRLFTEKANRLFQLSFVKSISDPKTGLKLSGERLKDGTFAVKSERHGPSREAIDAFVLTFRFFIQDNEISSFKNIASIYESLPVDPEFNKRFLSARDSVNQLLDSPNLLNIVFDEVKPTNREVLDVFIYGGLAHANPKKSHVYKEWMSFSPSAIIFEACFVSILSHVLRAIDFIAKLNEEVLKELQTQAKN